MVCDLDGVVYRGAGAVPGAPAALRRLAAHGVRIVYATNNASRCPARSLSTSPSSACRSPQTTS